MSALARKTPKSLSGFVANDHFKRSFIIQTIVLGGIMTVQKSHILLR